MSKIFLLNKFFLKNKKNLVFILLIIIFLSGFYLRIGGVLSSSFAFTYDVGRDMLQLSQIVNDHKIPLIGPTTGLAGLYYGPWWYYILTPAFVVTNGNPQGIAFFMVLTGLLTIYTGYLLGKKIGGEVLGIVICSFLALSAGMVGFSTQIWNPNIIPPLLILLLLLLVFLKEKSSILLSIWIGFVLGLIFDSEIVFGVLLVGGFTLSYLYLFRKNTLSISLVFIALGFIFTLLPRIFFEFRHQFVMVQSFLNPREESQRVFELTNFFSAIPDRAGTIIVQFGDTFGLGVQTSIILLIGLAAAWIFLKKEAKKKESELFYVSVILISVFVIGSSFFARAVWSHYLVGLPVLYIVVVSLVLVFLSRRYLFISIIAFFVLLVLSTKPEQRISDFKNPNWEGNAAVYRNQVSVVDYIYKDANGKSFNYIAYTPVVYDFTYQYLFDWYGKKKYGTNPSKNTKNLFYLIIEPDPGYEGRIKDWLKVREGDGNVIKEEVVKGGVKVQTRVR
jgi:4-amino-4-deoxy-L-arabinose transferase-like glycosyltransferase